MTEEIRDGDHVARYYLKRSMYPDGTPMPDAFKLRDSEAYLSVNWLECFGMPTMEAGMACVREDFGRNHSIVKNARFAVLNVGSIKRTVEESERVVHVKHLKEDDYPSHASIEYAREDESMIIILAGIVGKDDVYPAEE